LVVGTSIAAVIAAGALAALWLPVDASHRAAALQAPAPVSRAVDPGGELPTPPQTSASPCAPKGYTHQVPSAQHHTPMKPAQVVRKAPIDPAPTVQPDNPTEPVRVAEQPVPEQPIGTAAPTGAKPAAVKKPRHKTAGTRTYRNWAGANNLYRDE